MEIPESTILARQLRETIQGKTITFVKAAQSPHRFVWYAGDPEEYPELLLGRTVSGAKAAGGFVEIMVEDRTILLSDGVRMRYLAANVPIPQKHQLHLVFDDGSKMVCTVQMYGGIEVLLDGTYHNPYYDHAEEKPSPLSPEFDKTYFDRLVEESDSKLSVKAFLATKQRIPGLGNGVLHDILWDAEVNPKSSIGVLRSEETGRMFSSVKKILLLMALRGGRDSEKDLFGEPGGYQTRLSSKTLGFPCPRCGGDVVRKAYLGGSVYYCETCQPIVR